MRISQAIGKKDKFTIANKYHR